MDRHITAVTAVLLTAVLLTPYAAPAAATGKPRHIALTDITNEPDDEESMVRLLVYADVFDIEGLIATTGIFKQGNPATHVIVNQVNAYGEVLASLSEHSDFPDKQFLLDRVKTGNGGYGMWNVGDNHTSEGSNHIIDVVDKDDPRPVWVTVWGGANTLAQAIWDVRRWRTQEELEVFLGKLRVVDLTGQDDAGAWMCHEFPDLFYLRNIRSFRGISSEGGDGSYFSPGWIDANVQYHHGPLGTLYPDAMYIHEGDTPTYFHFLPNGLNDPSKPWHGGWGGLFSREKGENVGSLCIPYGLNEDAYKPYYMYWDVPDQWEGNNDEYCSIYRWRPDFQNDFAARMDWCVRPYAECNHNPFAVVEGDETKDVLYLDAKIGEPRTLDADGSSDLDDDRLSYNWWVYTQPGTYAGTVTVENASSKAATVQVPSDALDKTIHVILTLRDDGEPPLTSYRRVVLTGKEKIAVKARPAHRSGAHLQPAVCFLLSPRLASSRGHSCSGVVDVPPWANGFRAYTLAGREVMRWRAGRIADAAARVALPENLQAAPLVVRYKLSSPSE
jgi:hypothetical protein